MTVNELGQAAQSEQNISIYQELFELPEEYVEIVAELKARAKEVRLEYIQRGDPNRRRLTGNVAVAKLVLSDGVSYWQEATSKTKPMDRPVESPDGLTSKNGEPILVLKNILQLIEIRIILRNRLMTHTLNIKYSTLTQIFLRKRL